MVEVMARSQTSTRRHVNPLERQQLSELQHNDTEYRKPSASKEKSNEGDGN